MLYAIAVLTLIRYTMPAMLDTWHYSFLYLQLSTNTTPHQYCRRNLASGQNHHKVRVYIGFNKGLKNGSSNKLISLGGERQ